MEKSWIKDALIREIIEGTETIISPGPQCGGETIIDGGTVV